MTRILLIAAIPTKWDLEDRVAGNHSLPLAPEGEQAIAQVLDVLPPDVTAVYHCKDNEACHQAAVTIAGKYGLKPKHNDDLQEFNAGLWQGMRREEVRFRYPSVVEQWEDNPLAVEPPEGETIPRAIDRLTGALRTILRRNRGAAAAVVVRPIAQQILAGLCRGEPAEQMITHLQETTSLETIELSDQQVRTLLR